MRVFLAVGLSVALSLIACGGCSSTQMPSFLPSFGAKAKSKPHATNMTNAPPAPQFNSMSGVSPSVSMPPSSGGNLPVYPGTNYPQTPYPQQATAGGGMAPAYSTNPGGASGYASPYGAMPPTGATSSPYSQYPAAGGQPYAAAQQAPAYSAGQQVPGYAQQQAPTYDGGQASPYSAQQNPYGSTSEPYNAANPYGSYTR